MLKSIVLTLTGLFLSSCLLAQTWSGTTPGNIYYNSGNVGLGTSAPAATLHVEESSAAQALRVSSKFTTLSGSNAIAGYYNNSVLRTILSSLGTQTWYVNSGTAEAGLIAYSTPGGQPGILFLNTSGTGRSQIKQLSSSGGLAFGATTGNGIPGDHLVLTTGGNVGIGTATPVARLSFQDLNATTSPIGISWYNNAGAADPTQYGIHRTSGAWSAPNYQQLRLGWGTGIVLDPGTSYGKSYVDIQGNGLRITNGDVGIGTITPQSKLHVEGRSYFKTNDDAVVTFDNSDNSWQYMQFMGNGVRKAWMGIDEQGSFNIYKESGSAILFQGSSVGIGTTNVADQNFRLFVETGIRTRKVKVDQATWPDYVFAPSYHLPSLKEVEAFIKQHQHLPEVPSTEEVKKEGIDLGENQAVLLKKIEELTLYVIELKKESESQQRELEKLKEEVRR